MTRVIGIGGKLQHGKDVAADHLVDELGWVKIGMSDALNEVLMELNPWLRVEVTSEEKLKFLGITLDTKRVTTVDVRRYADTVRALGYTKAKEIPEVRRLLQVMGTEVGRKMIDPNIWTKLMAKKVREAKKAGAPGVVVTGIRFPNESKAIKTLDGELWWIERPGHTAEAASGSHDSENSLGADDFEVVILNDGKINDLRSKVDDLVD